MAGFKRGVFSGLPNNKYYKVGVKSLKQDLKPKRMIWNIIGPLVLIPASAKSTQILAVD